MLIFYGFPLRTGGNMTCDLPLHVTSPKGLIRRDKDTSLDDCRLWLSKIENVDMHKSLGFCIWKCSISIFFMCLQLVIKWFFTFGHKSNINNDERYFIKKRLRLRGRKSKLRFNIAMILMFVFKKEERCPIFSLHGDFITLEFIEYNSLNWESNLLDDIKIDYVLLLLL